MPCKRLIRVSREQQKFCYLEEWGAQVPFAHSFPHGEKGLKSYDRNNTHEFYGREIYYPWITHGVNIMKRKAKPYVSHNQLENAKKLAQRHETVSSASE